MNMEHSSNIPKDLSDIETLPEVDATAIPESASYLALYTDQNGQEWDSYYVNTEDGPRYFKVKRPEQI